MEGEYGRHHSEAPSSSSSNFYNTAVSEQQPDNITPPSAALTPRGHDLTRNDNHDQDADDEDSSSEMDVSDSSRASSPAPQPGPSQGQRAKRKLSDSNVPTDDAPRDIELDMSKKRKLSTSVRHTLDTRETGEAGFPVGLWQQVFLKLPPAMLCRCLRVCRNFNDYLTKTKATPAAKKGEPKVRILDSEAIWSHSRKAFFPSLPRPLQRSTELQMLQLVGGRTCQVCARQAVPSPVTTPFNSGPGPDGIRVIWPFGVRLCGTCLDQNTLKDVQLLQSPNASLRFGLPHIFLTPDLHYVANIQREQLTPQLRVSKVYYLQDVRRIVSELEDAKSLGDGAADEWRKGLHDRGQDEMKNGARWEQWEASMQMGSDLSQVLRKYDLSSFPQAVAQTPGKSYGGNIVPWMPPQPAPMANGSVAPPHQFQQFQNGFVLPQPVAGPLYQQAHRPVRDPLEVDAIRRARKWDIERRCLELEPPLEPDVLFHMKSFKDAMQITAHMTDAAWEMLKPRILAQREAAELAEHLRQEQRAALQAAVTHPTDMDFTKPAKEIFDKEYEHAQEPLRKKLGEYAQEYTDHHWNGAHHLDKSNCPAFAVEVMLHVHQRYLKDKEDRSVDTIAQPLRKGSSQSTPAAEPFLSLDNMKWAYDNKIRPLTDKHRRELFVCSGCTEERKPKWFAFEGLIQHYGAKHTTAFSKGNIVVHWHTSEWPDDPPFHTDPSYFTRAEKRAADYKAHGRPRNTPSANPDTPYPAPGNSRLLSENPLFAMSPQPGQTDANRSRYTPAGYRHHHEQTSPMASAQGYQYGSAIPAESIVDKSEPAQVNKLSNDAREIWDALEGVKDMPECIRIQAAIEIAVKRCQERFRTWIELDRLTDALATNAQIRPLKNAAGLACQICVASQTDGAANYQSYYARIRSVKLNSISSLITHFKIVHHPPEGPGYPDWTKDMIEIPELQSISDLRSAPGMDDDKLAIIASAFPTAFPAQLPKIGSVLELSQDPGQDNGIAGRLLDRMNKKSKQQSKKKGQHGANGVSTPGREGSNEPPLPEPKEDEYDPRRPMGLPLNINTHDPARFDTDIARQVSVAARASNTRMLNLAPETLAAINNLNGLALQSPSQQPHDDGRGDRSPSVGREERVHAAKNRPEGTPKAAPDISAILASLTGQIPPAQIGTPPASASNRSRSPPRYSPSDPYGQSRTAPVAQSGYKIDQRTSVPHYAQQNFHVPAERSSRYEIQDHQSTSAYNLHNFQQNQSQSRIEPAYAQPAYPQPAYSQAAYTQAQSPPQHQYYYDQSSQRDSRPGQIAPNYREAQAVQYVQLPPEQDYPPVQATPYQHHRSTSGSTAPPPPQQPVYVDEYGRPLRLIPIDSAPAPIQYLPHPFEQQQQQQRQQQQQQYYTPQAPEAAARPVYYSYPPTQSPPGSHQQHPGMY